MNKNKNLSIAEKTLQIIKEGSYYNKEKQIDVKSLIESSVENTLTFSPEELEVLVKSQARNLKGDISTSISVLNCSTLEALQKEIENLRIGVLNFASAKNPGGGLLGGASAQEESLARSSSLYASLIKDKTLYQTNKSNTTFLYSDYMIYSPNVIFWMNDDGNFFDEYKIVDVITSPAPNKGAMIQHNRQSEIGDLDIVFKNRIEKMLGLALDKKMECLILGAWGCGVFRNDPSQVAQFFKEVIEQKFKNQFKKIKFAIFDRSADKIVLKAFENVFTKSI